MQGSVKEEKEPSVMMFETKHTDVDFEKVKREKQSIKEKAASLLVKSVSERVKRSKHKDARLGRGYDPFGPFDKDKKAALIKFLQTCPECKKSKPKEDSTTYWYRTLRSPTKWLWDLHMDAGINLLRKRYAEHPEWFRSDRLCFVDSIFNSLWRSKYQAFLTTADEFGGGRVLPPNAYDLCTGVQPEFYKSNRLWGIQVDDI